MNERKTCSCYLKVCQTNLVLLESKSSYMYGFVCYSIYRKIQIISSLCTAAASPQPVTQARENMQPAVKRGKTCNRLPSAGKHATGYQARENMQPAAKRAKER